AAIFAARGLVPAPSDAPPPARGQAFVPPAGAPAPGGTPGGRGGAPGRGAPVGPMGRPTFSEMMFTDLIPMIERTYHALPGRENRAMAGLSMGGGQTFPTPLQH